MVTKGPSWKVVEENLTLNNVYNYLSVSLISDSEENKKFQKKTINLNFTIGIYINKKIIYFTNITYGKLNHKNLPNLDTED